jgi:hypothetical protein
VFEIRSPTPEAAYVSEPGLEGKKSFVKNVAPLAKFTPEHRLQCKIEMGAKVSMPRVSRLIVPESRYEN